MDDLGSLSPLWLPQELDLWLQDSLDALGTESGSSTSRGSAPVAPQQTLAPAPMDAGDGHPQATPVRKQSGLKRTKEQQKQRGPPKKRLRTGKSSSQRTKEELARLRQQASELQAQAERLRLAGVDLGSCCRRRDADGVWMGISKRQEGGRERAEQANAALKDALRAHARLVQRLDRVLRKAEEWHFLALSRQMERLAPEPWRDDGDVFKRLARSVDEHVFPRLDDVMGRRWRLSLQGNVSGESADKRRSDVLNAHFTAPEHSKVLPFDHRMVDEVSWRAMRSGKLKLGLQADLTLTQAEDLLACQTCVRPSAFKRTLDSEAPRVKIYLVIKRYQRAGSIVYAWESMRLLPAVQEIHPSPVRLVGRGWSETTPRKLRNGTEGCLTRSCMQWSIQDGSGAKTIADQGAIRMAEMLTEEDALSRAKIEQLLENLLLDESVRRSKRARA